MNESISKEVLSIYEKYKTKYKLPPFIKIISSFDISDIDLEPNFILQIMKKMLVHIDVVGKGVYELILPDTELFSMLESNHLGPAIHKKLFDIYRRFRLLLLHSYELEIDSKDKAIADHINLIYNEWNEIKPEVKKVYRKLYLFWKDEDLYKSFRSMSNDHYFG